MSANTERVHEVGVERHGGSWYHANRRAVEVLWQSPIKADSPEAKLTIPLLILKVLDGHMVDMGKVWNKEEKKWVPR